MKLFSFIKHELGKNEWRHHIIGFIVTLLGVFIALYLDQKREKNNEKEKMDEYIRRVVIELEANRLRIIRQKKVYDMNLELVRFSEGKRRKDHSLYCRHSSVDSLRKTNREIANHISLVDSVDANWGYYDANLLLTDPELTTDAWEMIKGSGLIRDLSPIFLHVLSDTYHKIVLENPMYNHQTLTTILSDAFSDAVFTEEERAMVVEHLESGSFMMDNKANIISSCVKSLKTLGDESHLWTPSIDSSDQQGDFIKWVKKGD